MAEFPSICPVRRQFKAAQFPTKRFTSISGAGTTRLYGNKGFDATLDVQFLVNDEHLIGITNNWEDSLGTYLPVTLPDAVVARNGELLDAIVPEYLEWHWAEPPTVESVNAGLHRVSVKLVAQLEING